MSLWARLAKSLGRRGLRRTLQSVASAIEDRWFEFSSGADTAGWVSLATLTIASRNKDQGERYRPTRARPFRKLMAAMAFPADSVFVDLGAGKGRALLLALRAGFRRVVGVEFSPQLCDEARRNARAFCRRAGIDAAVEVVEGDVADYRVRDDENVFYLFNPFKAGVIEALLAGIDASLARAPRKVWIIYNNPIHAEAVEARGYHRLMEYAYGGTTFRVFVKEA